MSFTSRPSGGPLEHAIEYVEAEKRIGFDMDSSSYEVNGFFNVQDYPAVFSRQRVIIEAVYDISDNRQDIPVSC